MLWCVFFLSLFCSTGPVQAGCREANLCCSGKNNSCIASGPRVNRRILDTCFCDDECDQLKDCCLDYAQFCERFKIRTPDVDCVLAPRWNPWSQCSESCGFGIKQRTRDILIEPRGNGRSCDVTEQKMACEGIYCNWSKYFSDHNSVKEPAQIIHAAFGSWRRSKMYNPYKDIRRNLFEHYEANSVLHTPSYCAKYEITESRTRCSLATVNHRTSALTVGTVVCVECQPSTFKRSTGRQCRGQGMYMRETRWNAVTSSGCHGRWIMKSVPTECTCNVHSDASFILV